MCLGLPASTVQLNAVKAWTGSLPLKRLFSVGACACVCSVLDLKKKKKLDNFHSSANPSCDRKMAVEHILD